MKKKELIKNLKEYNDWLKGKSEEKPGIEPTRLLDSAITAIMKANTKEIDHILKQGKL